jgi:hypothetical protein
LERLWGRREGNGEGGEKRRGDEREVMTRIIQVLLIDLNNSR